MTSTNIPTVKLGIIAVSRDCFPISLSTQRRENIVKAYKGELYDCPTTVENDQDMLKALDEVKAQGCNALVVFLGNFGPETPETVIAQKFDGPVMFVAAAEGDGDMINGRGDAFCGMLNCSYNLGMRHLKGYIPSYPVGTADDIAKMIADFVPVARTIIGLVRRTSSPATPPSRVSMSLVWRLRRTRSSTCSWLTAPIKMTSAFPRSAPTCRRRWVKAATIRSCCRAWRSLS